MKKTSIGGGIIFALLSSYPITAGDIETPNEQPAEESAQLMTVSHLLAAGTGSQSEFHRILEIFNNTKEPIIKTILDHSKSEYWSTHINDAFLTHVTSADIVHVIDMPKGDNRNQLLNILFEHIAIDEKRTNHLSNLLSTVSISVEQKGWLKTYKEGQMNAIAYAIYKGDVDVMKSIFAAYPALLKNLTTQAAHSLESGDTPAENNLVTWLMNGVTNSKVNLINGAIALIDLIKDTPEIAIDDDLFGLTVSLYKNDKISFDVLSNIAKRYQ